ncbi:MAG TPA: erythromycin esterase family protein, partial [Dongiaceae bacterium]|nr:erythromycin esterase family protein [Dongiaceae bacterium]
SAFNQGSFRSTPKGGGGLKTFTLPPAPPDSLDGTLAAAGIPAFALDLRTAPPWFSRPRASRQLGAIYNEKLPDNYLAEFKAPKAYDAVLFIDTTTAARANPGN